MSISPLAVVSTRARLGRNVSIGPFTVVHDDVEIGDESVIDSHCVIGYPTPNAQDAPLVIGAGAIIRSHSILYGGSRFGENLRLGHQVSVRENMRCGKNLQLGTLVDIQGESVIGDYCRFYDGAHLAQRSTIGDFVWIFPYVVFTNDPHPPSDGFHIGGTVEDYAVVATNATILPGVTIGTGALVGAGSLISLDVEPGSLVSGSPARKIAMARHVQLSDGSGPAYPWNRHFHRGFPDEILERWASGALGASTSSSK